MCLAAKQDDLFDDIDAVFIALWSTFHVGNRFQDIETIDSRNLATFFLGNFPEMSLKIRFTNLLCVDMYLGNTTGLWWHLVVAMERHPGAGGGNSTFTIVFIEMESQF